MARASSSGPLASVQGAQQECMIRIGSQGIAELGIGDECWLTGGFGISPSGEGEEVPCHGLGCRHRYVEKNDVSSSLS